MKLLFVPKGANAEGISLRGSRREAAGGVANGGTSMPCTTILVGKKASYDGSTLMARNEDCGPSKFKPKKLAVVNAEEQPRHYVSVLSGVTMDLPDNPMRYTAMPIALAGEGIWGEAGVNACNVAMSETETITSNPRVLGADPLVEGGIGEEDMLTIVLPYIHSAREGVQRLGELIGQYGTYEMNGIGFQDADEIWWVESIGGHHFIAKRVPDDAYVVMPNQQGIDSFDFTDAFGAQKEHICSPDLLEFIEKNHLDLTMEPRKLAKTKDFDVRAAFGSHTDSDHSYNTPRAWFMLRYLYPHTCVWDGENADYTPESDNLPWSMVPEHKVTIEDVKYVLSSYYQGTPFNPYARHGEAERRGMYRPIGINRNCFMAITQLRPYMPDELMAVEWISVGSNAFNEAIPLYANVTTVPEYLANAGEEPSTENFYWANRIVGALADAHYSACIAHIERYQKNLAAKGHEILAASDAGYMPGKEAHAYLEGCNRNIADEAKRQTNDLLGKVLHSASSEMKNAFSRADA